VTRGIDLCFVSERFWINAVKIENVE
jgi:hypothetical protein